MERFNMIGALAAGLLALSISASPSVAENILAGTITTMIAPAPIVLEKRQYGQTCGYFNGDINYPNSCPAGYQCAMNTRNDVFACCQDVAACYIATSCVPYLWVCDSACQLDPLVIKCGSVAKNCNTILHYEKGYAIPFTEYQCGTGLWRNTVFQVPTNGPISTPISLVAPVIPTTPTTPIPTLTTPIYIPPSPPITSTPFPSTPTALPQSVSNPSQTATTNGGSNSNSGNGNSGNGNGNNGGNNGNNGGTNGNNGVIINESHGSGLASLLYDASIKIEVILVFVLGFLLL